MTEVIPTYSPAERDRRWKLARDFMETKGLDALIVFGEHEDAGAAPYTFDNWFTNDRPGSTILATRRLRRIKASDIRAGRHADTLINAIEELDLSKSAIGVLGLEPAVPWHPEGIMPYGLWSKVQEKFPTAKFQSVGHEFIPLMLVLSKEELEVIRFAAKIGEDMSKAVVGMLGKGVSEAEIYASAMHVAYSSGTVIPWMHLNTGPTAVLWGPPRWAWRPQKPRVLQSGDIVAAEVFCSYGLRQTQHQVSAGILPVHEDFDRAAQVARSCYEAGMKALQPGAKFGDVAAAMLGPVEIAGGWTKGPQIHSLNPLAALCRFPAPPRAVISEAYPEVHGMDTFLGDMVLQPGMTFAMEPSCGFGEHGLTIGGTVIVGESGPIELNPFTAQFHRINA